MRAARARRVSNDETLLELRQQLAESKAAFEALASGQLDSITELAGPVLLREAQEALRRSEENFRALIEQLPDQVWVHRFGRVIYANPNALRCLGYESSELIGRDLLELVAPEFQESVRNRLRATTQVGTKAERYELQLRRRDGSSVTLEVSAQEVLFDGEAATLKVAHDITQRKELEAHLLVADRMASIGMLAAGVAHEINNPLAYVIANLTFVAQELVDHHPSGAGEAWFDEASAAMNEAREGAERVKGIVKDLRTFARSEDAERGSVNLHEVLDSADNMASNEVRHCARLVKDYADTPVTVEGNASRLGQVFLNLLVNATQAIPGGAADRNEIRIMTRVEPDGRVLIEVGDTGPGMSAEMLRRLFTPFFTTKPKGVGTGLGLSICHKIISAHGGEVRVESEVGKGATFRVWLPAASSPGAASRISGIRVPEGRRGRILVIDDEPLVGAAIRRILIPHHDADVVTSGREALLRLATGVSYDAVFCDLMMPEMSGPQVYEAINATDPELARRIVFISGGAFTESVRAFVDRVANVTLDKPFEVGKVLAVVAQFLQPSR